MQGVCCATTISSGVIKKKNLGLGDCGLGALRIVGHFCSRRSVKAASSRSRYIGLMSLAVFLGSKAFMSTKGHQKSQVAVSTKQASVERTLTAGVLRVFTAAAAGAGAHHQQQEYQHQSKG